MATILAYGLYACLSLPSLGRQAAPQASQSLPKTTLNRRTLVTEFTVKRGILTVIQGKKEDCQSEHRFVLHALGDQGTSLRGSSYRVTSWTGEVNALRISDSTPMGIDLYCIDPIEWNKNKSVTAFKRRILAEKGCVKGLLSFEEPLVCYYFLRGNQLVLLVQHGISSVFHSFDMNAVIEGIKQEE